MRSCGPGIEPQNPCIPETRKNYGIRRENKNKKLAQKRPMSCFFSIFFQIFAIQPRGNLHFFQKFLSCFWDSRGFGLSPRPAGRSAFLHLGWSSKKKKGGFTRPPLSVKNTDFLEFSLLLQGNTPNSGKVPGLANRLANQPFVGLSARTTPETSSDSLTINLLK